MTWLSDLLQKGGPNALGVIYMSGPTLALSLLHAFMPRKWAWTAGAILVGLIFAVGGLGYFEGRSRTDSAIEWRTREGKTSPEDLADMHARGYEEALVPLEIAGVVGGVCLLPLAVGEVRRRRRRT